MSITTTEFRHILATAIEVGSEQDWGAQESTPPEENIESVRLFDDVGLRTATGGIEVVMADGSRFHLTIQAAR